MVIPRHRDGVRFPRPLALLATLVIFVPLGASATGVPGTGPAVGLVFSVAVFDPATGPEKVFVAWADESSNIQAGLLDPADADFTAFPAIAAGYVTNLSVGVGGPPEDRRAYVTWVGSQLELFLAVYDAVGGLVGPAAPVASSVQITPNRLAGTDGGALVAHVWDSDPFWDPRVVEADLNGGVDQSRVVAHVVSPDQTLGVSISGVDDGRHGLSWVTSDNTLRLRRYDAIGAVDAAPVVVFQGASANYVPFSAAFTQTAGTPYLLLGAPWSPSPTQSPPDFRLAHATLDAGTVTAGPALSTLVPEFPGTAADFDGLAGTPELAVVLWEEVAREDPDSCGCSVPQPIRIEYFTQLLAAGVDPVAVGAPRSVFLWQEGDPVSQPKTVPVLVPSTRTAGRYTVFWSDGDLRYVTESGSPTTALDPVPSGVSLTLTSSPNPFRSATTLRFSLPGSGPVRLSIVDVSGRQIGVLLDGEADGEGSARWRGTGSRGSRLPAGIYFARLEHAGRTVTRKLVAVR